MSFEAKKAALFFKLISCCSGGLINLKTTHVMLDCFGSASLCTRHLHVLT